MTYLFFDKYDTLEDVLKLEAKTEQEALLKVINYAIEHNVITVESILEGLEWELKALDNIKDVK